MNDMYFWLGEDGETILVSEEDFAALQRGDREKTRKWRDVDTSPSKAYYFYGIIEPIEDDEDRDEYNEKWDDILGPDED